MLPRGLATLLRLEVLGLDQPHSWGLHGTVGVFHDGHLFQDFLSMILCNLLRLWLFLS